MKEAKCVEYYIIADHPPFLIMEGKFLNPKGDGFHILRGQSLLGVGKTEKECRKQIFDFVKKQTEQEIKNLQVRIEINKETLQILGDDKFNLGQFRITDFDNND